jgi:hypothetical protein
MTRLQRLNRWLSTPVRAVRSLFPFTREGRQTLVYLVFAGAGPALTLLVKWAMGQALDRKLNDAFASLADKVADALLVICLALACFVSIRAIKIGKDGMDVQGRDPAGDSPPTAGGE